MTQSPAQLDAGPQPVTTDEELLTADFMRRLEQLSLLSRRVLRGRTHGERRSKKRGQSVEFADYRNYVAGDDLRFIDWNLFARLDRLFLRLYVEEEDLSLAVMVDTTRSMEWGRPRKLLYAKRIAAALGYIALSHNNSLSVYSMCGGIVSQLTNLRGRVPVRDLFRYLQGLTPTQTPGDLALSCHHLGSTQKGRAVVVIISDFFDKGDLSSALTHLGMPRFETYAVQVLSPQELDPTRGGIVGDLRLRDVEDADTADVSVTSALMQRYRSNLEAYCRHVRHHCLRAGAVHTVVDTSVPFETVILQYLRDRGLVG